MKGREIAERVRWVGAMDWDRRLFDELIPLPDGTSYNSYLVTGTEKTALIDAVDPPKTGTLVARLEADGVKRIDYIVSHHTEQDHSGAIPAVLARYPGAQVLATELGRSMLVDHLGLPPEKITAVADGGRLSLGDLTLEFVHFPWVHWPETMLTWLPERRLLFTCDLFGAHLASSDLFANDDAVLLAAAKRYYAEIMMPFRTIIAKNLGKVTSLEPAMIAPSHGQVYRNPAFILDAYRDWVSAPPGNLVVIPYISMHESTRLLVEHLVEACANRGVRAEQFNLAEPDIGRLAVLLVDAATVVLGSPVVLAGAHPKVAYAALLANALRPKLRFVSVVGSYGWGGKMVEQLSSMIPNLRAEVLPPVLCKGLPKTADFEAIDRLADQIADRHGKL